MAKKTNKETMWHARARSLEFAPPSDLKTLQRQMGAEDTLVLKCTLPGCARCAAFDVEDGVTYEAQFRGSPIVLWNCADPAKRKLVEEAGVEEVPSYVVITRDSVKTTAV